MKSKLRIAFVGNMITLPYSPDHAGVLQALEQLKSTNKILDYLIVDCHQHNAHNLDIGETIGNFGANLVIHGMTDSLTNQWPEKIAAVLPNAIQVMSMWDYRPFDLNYDGLWDTWTKSGPYLDLVTLSNKNQLDWWAKDFGVNTMYWPHGCVVKDIEFDEQYKCDVVFTGDRHMSGPYKDRVEFIDQIDNILRTKGTAITWVNKGGGDADPERRQIWKDLGKIYHSAKTVLDISHFWDADGYASGRYFYTSGLGGCAIAKRFPGCEDLFPDGTKVYFDTPEEAAQQILYYASNKKASDIVKKKGKEWANKYHNYTVRFEQLFQELNL